MNTGIYIIRNENNGKIYIGQSKDLKRRLADHKRLLSSGKHPNFYMQHSYDNAEGNFSFNVLEYCSIEDLDEKEIFWISYFRSNERKNGYNIQSGGHLGHYWNEDARARRRGAGNPMYGRKMSPENVEKMRLQNRASSDKLTVKDVEDIKRALFDETCSMKELSEMYDVDFTTISKIKQCNNWGWVLPELNHKLKTMDKEKHDALVSEIIRLYNEGKNGEEIFRLLPCGRSFIHKTITEHFSDKKEAEKETLMKNIRQAVKNGLSDSDIKKKYNTSYSTICKYAGDIKAEKRRIQEQEKQALMEKVWRMRADGMLVKDIAEALGLHRTTITEYCKKIHGNTESA